jgi:hypothetical protein
MQLNGNYFENRILFLNSSLLILILTICPILLLYFVQMVIEMLNFLIQHLVSHDVFYLDLIFVFHVVDSCNFKLKQKKIKLNKRKKNSKTHFLAFLRLLFVAYIFFLLY